MFLQTKVNFSYWIDALIVSNICAFEHGHCTNAQRRDVRVFFYDFFYMTDNRMICSIPFTALNSLH